MNNIIARAAIPMLLALAPSAPATVILTVAPDATAVLFGSTATVSLEISGLGTNVAPSLAGYDLFLTYSETVLAPQSVTFGDPGLGNQLDLAGFSTFALSDTSTPGVISLFELSFDTFQDLIDLQADSFTMVRIVFDAIGTGVSPLQLTVNGLTDEIGNPITAELVDSTIESADAPSEIPEPGTFLVAGAALSWIFARRMTKGKANLS